MKKETTSLLGDVSFTYETFKDLDTLFLEFSEPSFTSLSLRKRAKKVCKTLLELIKQQEEPCFLLPAVIHFIDRVNQENILSEPLSLTLFEFWLNKFAKLSEEDNLKIRGKIVGKWIPRDEYRRLFPISSGKRFPGSHFIAAHASPDIDTTTASFWGYVDAFGARVADGVHQWSLPGTLPASHFTSFFKELFSPAIFSTVPRPQTQLTLSALDLLSQHDMIKININSHISAVDHTHAGKAIILVDDNNNYCGDFRSSDAEQVRHITMLFASTIRMFENVVHANLISIFAKKSIHIDDIKNAVLPILDVVIKNCDPVKDFTEKQRRYINDYIKKVLNIPQGINASFGELWKALDTSSEGKFALFFDSMSSLFDPELYDKNNRLIEDRPKIFTRLEKIILDLDDLISTVRTYIDRLSVMNEVKEKVLNIPLHFVTLKSDVEEMRTKMSGLEFLTVVIPEENGDLYPVGVIHAADLKRTNLGTCSLRDFSNKSETQMASYLEVISVIDHHKTDLATVSAPCFHIEDVQSSNTLIGNIAVQINKSYSFLNVEENTIDKELQALSKHLEKDEDIKRFRRLFEIKLAAAAKSTHSYFVHPKREFVEYFSFLYAILDDTDLLSKVTTTDVEVIALLLNRMKSIACKKDMEIIHFDDIPRNSGFAKACATRILQNKDMYSIYSKMYKFKEMETEENLRACAAGAATNIFSDTKEQNGCARVGQTKIFHSNYPFFAENVFSIRSRWFKDAVKAHEKNGSLDLHMHMTSTVTGADEVYTGHFSHWKHKDELWIWIPTTSQAEEHLIYFLTAFANSPDAKNIPMSVAFFGKNSVEFKRIFEQNVPRITIEDTESKESGDLPIAVLYYRAGAFNSRKSQISPFLPRLVP